MIALMLALTIGFTEDDASIRARIALELALLNVKPQPAKVVKLHPSYAEAKAQAIESNKPMVVFVNCYFRPVPGMVHCYSTSHHDDMTPRVVVGTGKWWIADLPADASDAEIRAAFNRWRAMQGSGKRTSGELDVATFGSPRSPAFNRWRSTQGSGSLRGPSSGGQDQMIRFRSPASFAPRRSANC